MKRNCAYCGKMTNTNSAIEYKQGLYVHMDCIRQVEKNMFSDLVSLNKEVIGVDGDHVELITLIPDNKPQDVKLGMDLRLAVDILRKKGKKQEAKALRYFIDGLAQDQMTSKFKRNKQRISQIVYSLRKELIKIGINELGYCQ